MKQLSTHLVLFLLALLVPWTIAAQENGSLLDGKWFFSFELPRSYTFEAADDGTKLKLSGTPSGFLAFIQSPIRLGLGVEKYSLTLANDSSRISLNNKITITMVDGFYTFPVPLVILGIGAGIGTAEVTGDSADNFKKSQVYQYFFRAGLAIPELGQLYAGVHKITAQIKFDDSDYLLESSGTMISLGIGMGF